MDRTRAFVLVPQTVSTTLVQNFGNGTCFWWELLLCFQTFVSAMTIARLAEDYVVLSKKTVHLQNCQLENKGNSWTTWYLTGETNKLMHRR